MLGIEYDSPEYQNFESMYNDVLKNNEDDAKNSILHQIKIDCYRTFRPFNLKFLNTEVESGQNKLYNLLKVYALILDPNVGYT